MNLLLTGCYRYTEEQKDILRSLGYVVHFLQQEAEALPLPPEEVEAVVCNGLFLHHQIDDFKNLRFVQLTSAGLDRVPLEKIRNRNIVLHNARGVYSTPMAEWAVFRVLEHFKNGRHFDAAQRSHLWSKHRGLREIAGSRIAVIGAGSVGQEVAKRFKDFDAMITGFDIHTNPIEGFDGMMYTKELADVIGDFDIVVVTAPLTAETHHLFSKELLMQLKWSAVLINIARGALIDEVALIDVLGKRPDIFAALDVFEHEPLDANSQLWNLPNVALSPHNSFVSDGNNGRMFSVILENLRNFLN